MKIGITSIQRNRGKWLKEWILFHRLVGVTNFYIYLHKCTDNSREIVSELSKRINIQFFELDGDIFRPQLAAFKHSYDNFGHEVDWMAFIDGDEFLYPAVENNLSDVLKLYSYQKMSALGVYWRCFGSNGHVKDPDGLIIEDYVMRSSDEFSGNRHIKSIVKGGQGESFSVLENAHFFKTIYGTYDEGLRFIDKGLMVELNPTYNNIAINHYVCQSLDFFKSFKQYSGAADAGGNYYRSDEWWQNVDRNDVLSLEICRFSPGLKSLFNDF